MPERLAKRVLLIGWDAADWQIINPMVEQGLMPTLASFLEGGVMGNIATMEPVLSPMLWTSIATGKRPAAHGIHGFIEPRHDGSGVHPVSALSRKCKAIWNILSQNGLKTNLINWYATHPAEPIDGVCVSDAFVRSGDRSGSAIPTASVHPAAMQASLEELRVKPEDITGHHIAPFIPKLGEIPFEKTGSLTGVQRMLARCGTIQAIATDLIEHEPWDLTAVYFEAIDHFGHAFMHYHPPRLPGIGVQEFEWYKECITGIYRFHDMMLERLLKLAGEETTVILVSDHGFLNNHLRPVSPTGEVAGPELWHRKFGIFAMRGPGIRKDERIHGAHLLDVAPTVLTLLGLPVGRDMDGKVLVQSFEHVPRVEAVDSWEKIDGPQSPGQHPPEMQIDPFEQAASLQQLVDLGYIEAPGDDAAKAIRTATNEASYNLAASHMEAEQYGRAVELLEPLCEANPEVPRFRAALAQSYLAMGRLKDLRGLIGHLAEVPPEKRPPRMAMLLGAVEMAERNYDKALQFLKEAEAADPRLPILHTQLGMVYARQRLWADAERAFRKALAIDPESSQAHFGLGHALLHQEKLEEAAQETLRAVGLTHYFPRAHLQLGIILTRLGWHDRAIQAFQTVITLRPRSPQAHRYLAALYFRAGDAGRAKLHQDLSRQISAARAGVPQTQPVG